MLVILNVDIGALLAMVKQRWLPQEAGHPQSRRLLPLHCPPDCCHQKQACTRQLTCLLST